MANWLITGGSGYLGQHLVNALNLSASDKHRLLLAPDRRSLELPQNPETLAPRIAEIEPEVVIHLAGLTPPAPASELLRVNAMGTATLLEALRIVGKPVRVVLAGSAAELGPVPVERLPVAEDWACRPSTPYGLSKLMATAAALAMPAPMETLVARLFNPIGPGASDRQAFGRFARLLAADDPSADDDAGADAARLRLPVGDLDARRDFLDVRDAAHALIQLAERGEPGLVYHIGSGESLRVGDGLAELIRLSGRSVAVIEEAERIDLSAPRDSRADPRRIRDITGWAPTMGWRQSLRDLWDWARLSNAPNHD